MNQNENIEQLSEEKVEETLEEQTLNEEHFEPLSKKEEKKLKKDKKAKLQQEIDALKEELKKKDQEVASYVEKIKLAQAELINYRKRKDDEVATMLKYCNKDLIVEILPQIDNFERALKQAEKSETEETKKIVDGVRMIYQGLLTALQKFGVEEINRVGQIFDPNQEQALVADSVEDKEDEVVLDVLQKGYKLKDRVIRAASVRINQK